jgi:hypothetical protein
MRAAPPGREAFGYLLLTGLPSFVGRVLGTAVLAAMNPSILTLVTISGASLLAAALLVSRLPARWTMRDDVSAAAP